MIEHVTDLHCVVQPHSLRWHSVTCFTAAPLCLLVASLVKIASTLYQNDVPYAMQTSGA